MAMIAAVPTSAGLCRFVRGYFVGASAASPDLWGFCGDAGRRVMAVFPVIRSPARGARSVRHRLRRPGGLYSLSGLLRVVVASVWQGACARLGVAYAVTLSEHSWQPATHEKLMGPDMLAGGLGAPQGPSVSHMRQGGSEEERRRHPRPRQPALRMGRRLPFRLRKPRLPLTRSPARRRHGLSGTCGGRIAAIGPGISSSPAPTLTGT
jgi:hypothetical protein